MDGIIDQMDPMLVEFAMFVLNNFGPKEAGYIYGMILYEVAETAAITAVTVGAGAALKAGLLPKFVNKLMKMPFLAGDAKVAVKLQEFLESVAKGTRSVLGRNTA